MASVIEILNDAEDDIRTIMKHKDNRYLRNLMEAAFVPEKKFKLPDGDPPYTPNPMEEAQVNPGVMWQICAKIDKFQRDSGGNKKIAIGVENMFINALETVSAKEAKVLLAVKDQQLDKVVKGLSKVRLIEVGYFK